MSSSETFSDAAASLVPIAQGDPPTQSAADPAEADLPSLHHAEIATARRYADASRAPRTQRAYASDWRRVSAWCLARGIETLPADPRAIRSGASVFKMREVSWHKSMQVLADSVRDAELFRDHAGKGFL